MVTDDAARERLMAGILPGGFGRRRRPSRSQLPEPTPQLTDKHRQKKKTAQENRFILMVRANRLRQQQRSAWRPGDGREQFELGYYRY